MEIVSIWNDELYLIVKKTQRHEIARVEFNADTLGKSWWSDEKMFDNCKAHKLYLNQDLASYAANVANLINSEVIHGKEVHVEADKKDFLNDFIRGIQTLSELDFSDFAMRNSKGSNRLEAPYRDHFFKWFRNLNYYSDRETLKGNNFIDLKVIEDSNKRNIIEFKGWWNSKKHSLILQIFNYLSQFEGVGYIFIINQTRKNITNKYYNLIATDANGYIKNSWEELQFGKTSFSYFKSQHELSGQKKVIYHFIFDIPFSRKIHERNLVDT